MRSFGEAASGVSPRFRGFEDRVRKLSAVGAWLCFVLSLGLTAVPTASAQTVTYIHTDALGSVVAESDANGNVIKRYDYEPYGAVVGGQVADGPGYTGHVSDAATGLSYMQQRYMDPQLGVFLSVDPVMASGGDSRHFNRYAYAYNNPYRFTDPDGRCPVCPVIVFFVVAMTHSESANAPAPGEAVQRAPVGDAFDAIPGGGAAVRGVRTTANMVDKTYTTYTRDHPARPTYSGKTSGTGTPEQQVAKRTAQPDHQAKTADGYRPATVDKNSSNPDAIAGREQRLIESNGGAQSQGGASANKINASSPSNPRHEARMQACKSEFGC